MSETAIKVDHISKSFKLPNERSSSLKGAIVNFWRRRKGYTEQHVLKDISFEVEKGEFFGIVGRNGSGKSTLLKIISEIYTPDSGSVTVNGKLTPFIELGVGFNPELTGRENVYLNGALLGFSHKEVEAMYDEIVNFAELEKFMDQKLKNYSSGMQVRLAFSVAIQAKSDILVLDEVLAVGDEAFQRKCDDYFNEIRQNKNQTVILVTHSMEAVKKYCTRAALIDKGMVKQLGSPNDVANEYSLENTANSVHLDKAASEEPIDNGIENLKVKLVSNKQANENDEVRFIIDYDVTRDIQTIPSFSLVDMDHNIWLQNDNMWNNIIKGTGHHKVEFSCKLPAYLNNNTIKIQASVWGGDEKILAFVHEDKTPKVVIRRNVSNNTHDLGVATGLLHIGGDWRVIE